jgi:hypothetical protein
LVGALSDTSQYYRFTRLRKGAIENHGKCSFFGGVKPNPGGFPGSAVVPTAPVGVSPAGSPDPTPLTIWVSQQADR